MSTSGKILMGIGIILVVGAVIVALSLSIVSYRQSSDATENIVNMPPPEGVPGAIGQTGATGPQGPPGPAGGMYFHTGWITSREGNYILNRTGGIGQASIAYLDKPDYVTNQYWTWTKDGQLQNKFGPGVQCMTGNDKGQVFINNCTSSDNLNQKWLWTNRGQINWGANKGKCLTVQKVNQLPGYPTVNPLKADGAYQIFLQNCSAKPGTNQQFFLGH